MPQGIAHLPAPSPAKAGEGAGAGSSLTSPTFVGEVGRRPGEGLRIAVLCVALTLAACAPKGDALYARAEQSLAKGEARAALIDLKNLVQAEPRNSKARALLGRALVASGDYAAAATELQQARALGAPKALTFVPECEVLVATGKFVRALADCRPENAAGDDVPSLQMVQGQALLGTKRAPEAKEKFQLVLAAKPDSLGALLGLANATYEAEGWLAARAVLGTATPAVQKQARYWTALGGISSVGGDYPGAEQSFAKAVELAGLDVSEKLMAFSGLAEAQLRQSKFKEATATAEQVKKLAPDNARAKALRGKVAAASGNLDQARTLLEEAVAAMPDNFGARTLLGIVDVQQGNLGQAEMHFANVLARQPDDVRVQRMLAEVRARQQSPLSQAAIADATKGHSEALNLARADLLKRDVASALNVLDGVLKDDPQFVPALQLAAAASLQAGQIEKAAGYVERLSRVAPDALGSHVMEGDLAMSQKRYGEALDHYRKAAAMGTNSVLVLAQYRAALLAGTPQPWKVLEEWAAANPKSVEVVTVLAEDRHRRGDADGAIRLYENSLAQLPDNIVLLNNLAVLYQAKGNPAAVVVAAKAYAAAPKVAAIQDTYGWLLVETGKVDKGLELLKEAAKGLPGNAEVQYHYAAALAKSGSTTVAISTLKMALKGQLPPRARADAQTLLTQISN